MMVTDSPIKVTPLAAERVQKTLAEKNLEGYGLRIFVSGGGCGGFQYGMAFEQKSEEGDFVFDSNGIRVYLDSASSMYLEGAVVDYVDSLMGGGFRIENPNATTSCACGQSFSSGGGGGGGCGHH
ncbi:MAG: iron-sulfur cluster insertion protein ErpA [Chloroflexi bacterium]|nr:iron-sulfur cluster insertion protein ErpA [Chloroflexota bacterium]